MDTSPDLAHSADMKLRPVKDEDAETIFSIWERNHKSDFPFPTLDDTLVHGVIDTSEGIVAYGMLKKMTEAIFILDLEKPLRDKVLALTELISAMRGIAQAEGLKQIHVFTSQEFAQVLMKHFNFEPTKDVVLVMNVPEV